MSTRRVAALMLLIALLAACGDNGGPAAEGGGAPARSAAPLDLRVALLAPGSLDPHKITTEPATAILKQMCDTLVGFDPGTGALKPAIAESWTVAPDARKVTFQLRPGVKFHNGRDLVAEDYVYSLSRLADPKTGSAQHFLLDKVEGYTEMRSSRATVLSGVKAPSPQTLEVELSQPFAEFPAIMTNITAGTAVPKEEIDRAAAEFADRPVCTGPYRAESAKTAEGMTLVRHDGYYGANEAFSGGGRGLPNSMEFRFAGSEEDAYELVEAGDADVGPVAPADLAKAREVEDRVTSAPNGHVTYLGLPVKKAPFDNLDVRRALAMSVDREAIISGLLGDSREAPSGFLPASAGPASGAGRCAAISEGTAEPEEAGQVLGQARLPESVNVYLNSGGGHEQWLEQVLDHWNEALGMNGVLKPNAWEAYLDLLTNPGADGPFRLAWTVEYPSPEALFAPLFSSSSLDNYTRYSSQEFDTAMNRARATVDEAARAQIYGEAGAMVCRDLPILPMWFGRNHFAFGEGIEGAGGVRVDIFGDPILRELRRG